MDWLRRHPILGFILLVPLFPISAPMVLLYLILQAILRKGQPQTPTRASVPVISAPVSPPLITSSVPHVDYVSARDWGN